MRLLALLLLLALPACKACDKPPEPELGEAWPPGGSQGLLDGCISKKQKRKICDCLAKRIPEQVSWKDFVHKQEDEAAHRQVNPTTQAAIDRVTNECSSAAP